MRYNFSDRDKTLLSTEIGIAEYRRWIPEALNLTK
jgi:hypothetical protein